uniref:Uncharacterized protein n=1 Tax=Syphacia muris TaxID=451379 RepID=A0A0N5A9C8_9BILA
MLLATSNCFREQLLFLRKYQNSDVVSFTSYFSVLHSELSYVMKQSFEEEFRKLADFLGFLETLAELLVSDVCAFGLQCPQENIAIRRLIANALTNLTYRDLQRKRRLCSYPNFIECVVKVIDGMQVLAQMYAALLRNLSWNADSEMNTQLCLTVPVLARASLRAFTMKDFRCLCVTLSALWNLSSVVQNRITLCKYPHFLEMLIDLLVDDPQRTALVESATGVLKYASFSFEVAGIVKQTSAIVLHRMLLKLLDLLRSSSFIIITNCLFVLLRLLKNDYQLRTQIKINLKAMQILHRLRDSKHREVSNIVKTILDKLNETDASYFPSDVHGIGHSSGVSPFVSNNMMSSCTGVVTGILTPESAYNSSQLLKIHSMQLETPLPYFGSLAADAGISMGHYSCQAAAAPLSVPTSVAQCRFAPRPGATDVQRQQFNSLPRQCYRNGANDAVDNVNLRAPFQLGSHQFGSGDVTSLDSSARSGDFNEEGLKQTNYPIVYGTAADPNLCCIGDQDDDPSFDIEESVRCTRGSSTQSLSSLLPSEKSGWTSCNNSAVNSNRLSPVSASELPDSPTHYSILKNREISITNTKSELDVNAGAVGSTSEDVDGGGGANNFELESPDFPSDSTEKVLQATTLLNKMSLDEGKDGGNSGSSGASKDEQLANEESSVFLKYVEDDYGSFNFVADTELLNQSIEAAMPKRPEVNDDFLTEMIEQAQPKPSPVRREMFNEIRNFSSASTSRMHSDSSSMRTEEYDFLQQSINSVLPQSTSSSSHATSAVQPFSDAFKRRIF